MNVSDIGAGSWSRLGQTVTIINEVVDVPEAMTVDERVDRLERRLARSEASTDVAH